MSDALQEKLVSACESGDLAAIRKLVAEGAAVNERGAHRMSGMAQPMVIAAGGKGGVAVLELLLELGGDLTVADGYTTTGDRAMSRAVAFGKADVVGYLRGKGIGVGPDALIGQCRFGTKKSIAFCLAQGCPPERSASEGSKGSVLHAFADGKVKDVDALVSDFIARGAELEGRDMYGRTPLYVAAANGRDDLVKLYLRHGADPNAVCGDKTIRAVAKNQTIRKLLDGDGDGAKPKAKDKAEPKRTSKLPLSAKDLEALYTTYAGNFFEGPWADDDKLAHALFAFAKEHYARLAEDAGDDVVSLEGLLRDEEGPEAIAEFLGSLSPTAFKKACGAVADALDAMSDTAATKWAKKLRKA